MTRQEGRSVRVPGLSHDGRRQPGDVRCPSCGCLYQPSALRLRRGATRGLAICASCYHLDGPDGQLQPESRQ